MNKKGKYIILVVIIIVSFIMATTIIASASESSTTSVLTESESEPNYKLKDNIKEIFRPEWIWNEEKQDYVDTGSLERDSESGLFIEPKEFPKELEGYAHWDAYLGLYIINSIQINHETGIIIENPMEGTMSVTSGYPEYNLNISDEFDKKYMEFQELVSKKYVKDSSLAYPEMYIIEEEGLTQEWFNLSVKDLPMLIDKLEKGAPTSYTMSMILLVTKVDVGFYPTIGAPYEFSQWVDTFNELTSNSKKLVEEENYENLGYLSLPTLYDQLVNGNDKVISWLPQMTAGLYTESKLEVESWNKHKWIEWFENNNDLVEALRNSINHEIKLAWLD